jgi:hypothetical protein
VNQNARYYLRLGGLARAPPKTPRIVVFVQWSFNKSADFNCWKMLKGEKR